MNTDTNQVYRQEDWSQIDWKQVEKAIFKLQKRIFKASQKGDILKVKRLQKLLISSHYGKLWAVRKVTQENKGKNTAGVDGVKSVSPAKRLELAKSLKLEGKSKPVKRIYIPKKDGSLRGLGIPTIKDRALQYLVKLGLEPEWEAKFEGNSYGFRPARSGHDAIEAIHNSLKYKNKYVLDADIEKCFDKINHDKLLDALNTSPKIRKQIKAWLKSGVVSEGNLIQSNEGTPQGGVISPLLTNIILNGMEEAVKSYVETIPLRAANSYIEGRKANTLPKAVRRATLGFVRYADDFVILHEDREVVEKCKEIISEFLEKIGLKLKDSKTRIGHSFNQVNGKAGFDFLGFEIRQYPITTHTSGRCNGSPLGFKTIIKPSKESIKKHIKQIGDIIRSHRSISQEGLIEKLNPIIRGWCNYYRTVCSKKIFSKLDHIIYLQLKRWAERRHPKKNKTWVTKKYWHKVGGNNWIFSTLWEGEVKYKLLLHDSFEIKRHVQVNVKRSIYDGDWTYWGKRLSNFVGLSSTNVILLKKQKGKCNHCQLNFVLGDKLEIDHIISKRQGGDDSLKNKQLLHLHCHDQKTANELRS